MSDHTKEPWGVNVCTDGEILLCGSHGRLILQDEDTNAISDARRIVACVNACAGVPTAFIDGLSQGLKIRGAPLDTFIQDINKNNADLLSALKIARDYVASEVIATAEAYGDRLQHKQKLISDDLAMIDSIIYKCEAK